MEGNAVRAQLVILGLLLSVAHAICAEGTTPAPFKGEYILQRSIHGMENGNYLCQRFTDNLNRYRKLDFDVCHPRISERFDFSRPYQWEEIPFDLVQAEKAIKSSTWSETTEPDMVAYHKQLREKKWAAWLNNTKAVRAAGKARMWITNIDIDSDGEPETILRMQPQGRYPFDPHQDDVHHCDYDRGELYVIEAKNPETAGQFNASADINGDIVFDGKTGVWYLLEWSRSRVGDTDIGATRGVVVRTLSPMDGPYPPYPFIPGVARCEIDWVPEGQYKPARKKSLK
jgi:hypothetical protein